MKNLFKSPFGKRGNGSIGPDQLGQVLTELFGPTSFNTERGFFLVPHAAIGVALLCDPVSKTDSSLEDAAKKIFELDFPAGSTLQFCLFRSPNITRQLRRYEKLLFPKDNADQELRDLTSERLRFMRTHTCTPMTAECLSDGVSADGIIFDTKLLISLTCPIAGTVPQEEEIAQLERLQKELLRAVLALGTSATLIGPNDYLNFVAPMMNWSKNAKWADGSLDLWKKDVPICQQIAEPNTELKVFSTHLDLGNKAYVQACPVIDFPENYSFGDAMAYAVQAQEYERKRRFPYAVCYTFAYKELRCTQKCGTASAFNLIEKFASRFGKKKEIPCVSKDSGASDSRMKMSMTILVWGKTKEQCDKNAEEIRSSWEEKGFLMYDKPAQLLDIARSLPLNAYEAIVQLPCNFVPATSEQAAKFAPIFGEWKGTDHPRVPLISQNGQLANFSLENHGHSSHCVIAGSSGSGKISFLNEIITSYLSAGAKIWVIDGSGNFYKSLCENLKGNYIRFDGNTDALPNPFKFINNYDEEEDVIVSLLLALVQMRLTAPQIANLKKVTKSLWEKLGHSLTIDVVAEALQEEEDAFLKCVGRYLSAFIQDAGCKRGASKYNCADSNAGLTVLDLNDRQNETRIRQALLLDLIMQIQHDACRCHPRPSIVIIDEAWDLLEGENVARFMEGVYRKSRMYEGSLVVTASSLEELFKSPVMDVAAKHSGSMCVLGQNKETIEEAHAAGLIDEEMFSRLMKAGKAPHNISNIVIKAGEKSGTYRLVIDECSKLLYSLDPLDRNAIKQATDTGLSTLEAIKDVLESRRG